MKRSEESQWIHARAFHFKTSIYYFIDDCIILWAIYYYLSKNLFIKKFALKHWAWAESHLRHINEQQTENHTRRAIYSNH